MTRHLAQLIFVTACGMLGFRLAEAGLGEWWEAFGAFVGAAAGALLAIGHAQVGAARRRAQARALRLVQDELKDPT